MDRISNELAHGRRISDKPEFYWGWSGKAGGLRAERRAAMYVSAGRLAPGRKALEIGCGTGVFTSLVARTGARITAIDLSPDLLLQATAAHSASNVRFLVMNAEKLEFPAASFDCVYGTSVLHHLDLEKTLPEMLRVLKPGGVFVFTEPNMLNPQIMLQKNIPQLKDRLGDSPDETAFFKWGIVKELSGAGFKEPKAVPFDFLHPWVPALLAAPANALGRFLERVPLLREVAGSLLITAGKCG